MSINQNEAKKTKGEKNKVMLRVYISKDLNTFIYKLAHKNALDDIKPNTKSGIVQDALEHYFALPEIKAQLDKQFTTQEKKSTQKNKKSQ
ncbi:MAG: hypothetical protein RXO54_04055 [Acidilobus sp.]